jgi:signal transduction histidine kinase
MVGDAVRVLEALQPVIYAAVALAGLWRWWGQRTAASAYAAMSFVVLSGVVIIGRVLPTDTSEAVLARKLDIAFLVLFPYLLFRFAGSFSHIPTVLEVLGAALTVFASLGVFVIGDLPAEGEDPSSRFLIYSAVILVQWVLLSAYVTSALWRAGAGRPTVTRRRMRTLALGAAGMALALALAVANQGSDRVGLGQLVTAVLASATAPLFLFGVAPPRAVLATWRRADELALREAEMGLVAATTSSEVGEALLPHVARAAGSTAALLSTRDQQIIAAYGLTAADAARYASGLGKAADPRLVSVSLQSGWLAVIADQRSPYFGHEETEVLDRIGIMTDLALRRAQLVEAERTAARDLERANSAMRQFVAVASHDLRTPIAIIRGFCSSVIDGWAEVSDEEKKGIFETVDRQASHLSRIVNDLMMISRIDSGVIAPNVAAIALEPVVRGVLRDMRREDDANVSVGDVTVMADEDHLVRIVRNLVENACTYGSPPIDVTAVADGADMAVLRVRDHGPGVNPDFVPRLFERFARDATTAAAAKGGTGLGLSIVQGLALAGGGDARYEGVDEGTGACFAVRLPTPRRTGS